VRHRVTRHDTAQGKAIRPWHLDGRSESVLGKGEGAWPPYCLSELLAADPSEPVFVGEGEKVVDTLRNAGLIATTNDGGAGKWTAEHAAYLCGRAVVILPDNDEPGRQHARAVAASLIGIASSVKLVDLASLPVKGDAVDWLAAGGTRDELRRLARVAPEVNPYLERSVGNDGPAPFPTEVFPPAIRAYVEAGAVAFGVPADMIAIPMIAFAAAVIGNSVVLELKAGWQERAILWLAVVGRPGTGKSPALDHARRLLDGLQRTAWEDYEQRLTEWESMERRAKQGRALDHQPTKRPTLESFFTTDATTEALAGITQGSAGVVVIRDELIGWVTSMDAYRAAGDRQTHLSLWAGAPLKVDRKSAPPLYVPDPCVCVVGGTQPDRLADLRSEAGKDDGFFDRFLIGWPDASPATWSEATVPPQVVETAEAVFRALRGTRTAPPVVARLTPEALDAFVAWHDENATSAHGATGLAAGCATKYPRQVARLALVLHALWNVDDPTRPVGVDTMHGALMIIEYFRAHLGRVLAAVGAPGASRPSGVAIRLLRILERAGDGWVSRTDLHAGLGRSVPAVDLTEALERLEVEGRVERQSVETNRRDREEWRQCVPRTYEVMNPSHRWVSVDPADGDDFIGSYLHADADEPVDAASNDESFDETVANLLALSPDDLAQYRAELAASSDDDPHLAHDRAALAFADQWLSGPSREVAD